MRNFTFSIVVEKPKVWLAISLVFGAVFWAFNPFVRTVDNVDYFRLEDDPAAAFYEEFKRVFGNDEFFVIAFETDNLFTAENLGLLRDITTDLEKLEEAEKVRSLANVEDIVGGEDYFEVRRFLEEIPKDKESLAELKARALGNALYLKNLVSPDGKTAAIVVETADRPRDWGYRKRLIEKTRNVLSEYEKKAGTFHLAGWTVTNLSLSQYLKKDMTTFVPATYLFIMLTVWFFFRNTELTLLAVINISACVGATRGFMGMTGVALNNVTIVVIPLVMALALCDTVHIFSHLDRRMLIRFGGKEAALAEVIRQVVLPCFLTTLTTAVGFASLAVSRTFRRRQEDGIFGVESYLKRSEGGILPDNGSPSAIVRRERPVIVLGLFQVMYHEAKRRSITHMYMITEQKLFFALRNFVIFFKQIGDPMEYHGTRIPYMGEVAEMERILKERFPTTLRMLLHGLEARYHP